MYRKLIIIPIIFACNLFAPKIVYAEYTKALTAGTSFDNPATTWAAGDDTSKQVNLGFTFPFGSVSSPNNTNQIYINSNGGLSFSNWTTYNNVAFPTNPETIIAPYWDDLDPSASGSITYSSYGTAGNKYFVVSWNNVQRYGQASTRCSFQVVLYENGNIRFRYSTANQQCNGNSASIGIQESNSDYLQHSNNQAIDLTQDILFTPTATPPPPPPVAAPLAVNSCDDFESDLSNWTTTGYATISGQTANSPTHSLSISAGNSSATSITINTTNNLKEVTVWIRRGSDSFSEDTDAGEDLYLEYLNNANNWIQLEQFLGSGTKGQIYNRTYTMPADARHSSFQLRFNMINGSGANYDYWHIDDVCLTSLVAYPSISISKTSSVISDPVNQQTNPKRIPGALLEYTIGVTNTGSGQADNNTTILTDAIPSNTALYVNDISGSGTGPVRFVDGSPPSGLSYTFNGLSSTTDSVSFSNNGGATYNYSPTPDAEGVDIAVTHIKIQPQGAFLGNSGSGSPNFELLFRIKVQ